MEDDLLRFRIRFGLRIRDLRISKGIAQGALSSMLDKDKQFINRYENDGANPSAYIVFQIANALSEPINKFYDFSKLSEQEVENIFIKLKNKSA